MSSSPFTRPARIFILGAGNLGQYLARGLANTSPTPPVTLLFHRKGLLDDWRSAGREIKCEYEGRTDYTKGVDVELVSDITNHQAAPIENLIVACKTYLTVTALEQVKSRLTPKSTIVFLQNGMGMVPVSLMPL
jgi:2-dehydropantoate 2-reductase